MVAKYKGPPLISNPLFCSKAYNFVRYFTSAPRPAESKEKEDKNLTTFQQVLLLLLLLLLL